MKIYIAGKITGESRASVAEKFSNAMCKLKSAGHLPFNPSVLPDAEIGKREICNMGLVLQSDMDKTIGQNMELKKILDAYRDFIAEKKLQEEFKRFLKEVEK